jgi:hypothetical protein
VSAAQQAVTAGVTRRSLRSLSRPPLNGSIVSVQGLTVWGIDRLEGDTPSPLAINCWRFQVPSEEDAVEAKEAVRALLDRLPDDCSVEDVLYHLYVLQAIERGQADAGVGRTIPHAEVDRALRRKWLGRGEE